MTLKLGDGVKVHQFSTKTDKVSLKNNRFYGSSTYGQIERTEWGKQLESYDGGFGGHSVGTWINDLVNYWRGLEIMVNVIE